MAIVKTETTKGCAVRFPFELKDHFRRAFPSAKWNSLTKSWEVGSRSIKRLDGWIAEATPLAEALAVDEELEMTGDEVARMRREFEQMQAGVTRRADALEAIERNRAAVATMAPALKAAEAEQTALDARIAETRRTIAKDVGRAINEAEVMDAVDKMRRAARSWPQASARPFYETAHKFVDAQHDRLLAAGLDSPSLRRAAATHWNRVGKERAAFDVDLGDTHVV